jgi:putative hydrolase of the HAD superfamily
VKRAGPRWRNGETLPRCALFDLDDTLYPKSAGVMQEVSKRISQYMASRLQMDETTVQTLRTRYWNQYGTTMRGLLLEYGIDADDYLRYVHDFPVEQWLKPNDRVKEALAGLLWQRVIFTNAPRKHADNVLRALGITQYFERVFDIQTTGYVGKPDPVAYQFVLDAVGALAQECIVLDDGMANLHAAAKLGMITVLVGSDQPADGVDFSIAAVEHVSEVARKITNQTVSHPMEGMESNAG